MASLTAAGPGRKDTRPAPVASGAMKPVGSIKDVMKAITIPTSSVVFKAASEPPKEVGGWESVQSQALALAESANLLMIAGRAPKGADWNRFAAAEREAAVVAMKAAASHDADALSNASDALYETCSNCHAQYMPKP